MKISLLSLFVVFLVHCVQLNAQQYYPIPDSAVSWREYYSWYNQFSNANVECQYYAEGDTIFQNQHYAKIFKTYSGFGNPGGYAQSIHEFYCGIRNDSSKRVFQYFPSQGSEDLLYDFNLVLGQTLPLTANTFYSYHYISAIDSIFVNGNFHKRYWLTDTISPFPVNGQLIEGVGSSFGLFGSIDNQFEHVNYLKCFYSTDTLLVNPTCNPVPLVGINSIEVENGFNIFPNPNPGNFAIHFNGIVPQENLQWKFADCTGRTIADGEFSSNSNYTLDFSFLPEGLYFLFIQTKENTIQPMKVMILK